MPDEATEEKIRKDLTQLINRVSTINRDTPQRIQRNYENKWSDHYKLHTRLYKLLSINFPRKQRDVIYNYKF